VTRAGASWVAAALAAILVLLLLLPGLGRAPFDDPGEGQHAEIAREAWASGHYLDLRLNGVRYFDKPPLLYWLIALDFRVWGISEWAARLPSVLGAALAVGATALLGARLVDPRTGVLAGTALASSALFLVFGRYVRPETLFVASIQVGLTGLLLARCEEGGERRHLWAVLGCASLGAAALVKDPLGLLAPLGAVAVALALGGQLRPFRLWLPPVGVALMLVLSLGWYAWAAITQRGFLWYTVVDNHLLNAMGRRRFPDEDVPLAAIEFLAVSALGAFPWVLAATGAVVSLVRRRAWRDPEEAPWIALAIWLVGLWALCCLSAFRLPHYGLPAYPALALLAARWWSDDGSRTRWPAALHAVLFALLAVTLGLIAAGNGAAFLDTVFSATDVYTRKEATSAQASPLPPWSASASAPGAAHGGGPARLSRRPCSPLCPQRCGPSRSCLRDARWRAWLPRCAGSPRPRPCSSTKGPSRTPARSNFIWAAARSSSMQEEASSESGRRFPTRRPPSGRRRPCARPGSPGHPYYW